MRYAVLIFLALVAGCGQKGALTLPDKHPGTVVTRPTQTQAPTAPTDDTQKKKDETDQNP